jgi:hypothetical protein
LPLSRGVDRASLGCTSQKKFCSAGACRTRLRAGVNGRSGPQGGPTDAAFNSQWQPIGRSCVRRRTHKRHGSGSHAKRPAQLPLAASACRKMGNLETLSVATALRVPSRVPDVPDRASHNHSRGESEKILASRRPRGPRAPLVALALDGNVKSKDALFHARAHCTAGNLTSRSLLFLYPRRSSVEGGQRPRTRVPRGGALALATANEGWQAQPNAPRRYAAKGCGLRLGGGASYIARGAIPPVPGRTSSGTSVQTVRRIS